jgi:hypothetical protein
MWQVIQSSTISHCAFMIILKSCTNLYSEYIYSGLIVYSILMDLNRFQKIKPPPSPRVLLREERPAAAASRQGFTSPKIDWYDQSTCDW